MGLSGDADQPTISYHLSPITYHHERLCNLLTSKQNALLRFVDYQPDHQPQRIMGEPIDKEIAHNHGSLLPTPLLRVAQSPGGRNIRAHEITVSFLPVFAMAQA